MSNLTTLSSYEWSPNNPRQENIDSALSYQKRILYRIKHWWNQEVSNKKKGIHPKYICTKSCKNAKELMDNLYCCSLWQRRLSNKLNSKFFVESLGIPTAKLYWSGSNIKDIPFSKLPKHYVIRPTAGCGSQGVFVMNGNNNLKDGKKYSNAQIAKALEQYQEKMNRKIVFLFEEFVKTLDNKYQVPTDYKIHMFADKVGIIQRVSESDHNKGKHQLYDENWKTFPHKYLLCYPFDEIKPPPPHLKKMLQYAKKIGKIYNTYIRIDFFETPSGPVFCEFTPTPCRGLHVTEEGNKYLVKLWDNMRKNNASNEIPADLTCMPCN